MSSAYATEARRRAHQLRSAGLSQRAIAAELGVTQQRVSQWLKAPPEHMSDKSNVRDLQEVWPDLTLHNPDIGVVSPGQRGVQGCPSWGLMDTDDTPECRCAWGFNLRDRRTGVFYSYLRHPDAEEEINRTPMRFVCPLHNAALVQNQVGRIERHAPDLLWAACFYDYRHLDSARRVAHRLRKKDKDSSYIAISRKTWTGEIVYHFVGAFNPTPRAKSRTRASTTETDFYNAQPYLQTSLQDTEALRRVTTKWLWQLPRDDDEYERSEDPHHDIITSGAKKLVTDVALEVLGRRLYSGEVIAWDDWVKVEAYIKG